MDRFSSVITFPTSAKSQNSTAGHQTDINSTKTPIKEISEPA